MKFSEWILLKENIQLELPFKSEKPNPNPKVVLSGWSKDGSIFANIDGESKTFVTDALYHNRLRKMKPFMAYKEILRLIDKDMAFELKKRRR